MKAPLAAAMLVAAFGATTVAAADWKPDKRIEFVVPNAPGGGNDRIARLVDRIAQQRHFVDPVATVVNKPGAGVMLGLNYINQHAGDAHYVAIISATFVGDSVSGRNSIGINDITPLAQLLTEYVAFAVKADSPLKNSKELVARLKTDASAVSTAIAGGIGNHNYLALALLTRAVGGDLKKLKVAVFNAGSEAVAAALGGHVDLVIAPAATLLPHARAGTLRVLAIAAPKRLPGPYADVPATAELGVTTTLSNWRAMIGPKGLAQAQVSYWDETLARVVATDEWKNMLEKDSLNGEFLKSAETKTQLQTEYAEFKSILTELGLVKK